MPNRLASETSPYLLQHRDNPVDWYPWGDEAFAKARGEDRPILLSVGYSACHWCHVMEHESFSDPETAALMNELFVSIKVDREERPDVDSVYMQAVQQMTGHGGWPMTVFLTPEGAPFYGGTYFPPEPRHGLPAFRQLLRAIGDAYRDRRDEVLQTSADLRDLLHRGMLVNPEPSSIDESTLHRAFHGLVAKFDHRLGGFGGAPKFPQPMLLDFLLRYWSRTGASDALPVVERTLGAMARGGIYDHLGGGFHRYSVDARWLVPHFEKMLYDNALLSRIYLRAFQVTGREEYRRVVEDTLGYVAREMRSDEGAFFSSQDADSEGEEGRFYVWSADEIDEVLGPEEGPLFRLHYDVAPGGNWEGKSILHTPRPLDEVASDLGVPPSRVEEVVDRGRPLLYARRTNREWPGRDEKAITSWNAMMLHTFAEAGRVLDSDDYVAISITNAEFLLRELRSGDRLLRTWRDGVARIGGFLEDYATLADALVELYSATYDPRWVREARWVADRMVDRFWAPQEEMFFDTAADDGELIIRPRDIYDNATPSGTSAAVQGLIRLGRLCGEPRYERIASRVLSGIGDMASRVPQAFGNFLGGLVAYSTPASEVAIVGRSGAEDTSALLHAVRTRYLPHTTVAFRPVDRESGDLETLIPLLAHREMLEGSATAFVCQHFACRRPVTSVQDLERELEEVIVQGTNTRQ
jgi:uncharacterized protein